MRVYEPKEGSGWEEGPSSLPGVRRWRTPVEDGRRHLSVTVAEWAFVIARVAYRPTSQVNSLPRPEDLGRIELDFGVHAWSILGESPVLPPSVGSCLMAKAVEPDA